MVSTRKIRVVGVLLAAGSGSRFGNQRPKQYVRVGDRLLLQYSLDAMLDAKIFSEVVVVHDTQKTSKKIIQDLMSRYRDRNVRFIAGGSSRYESTRNAINFLKDTDVDYVLFHDAARPYVRRSLFREVVRQGIKYNAAIVGMPVLESVASVEKQCIADALPSSKLYSMQTPECFQFHMLLEAYERFQFNKKNGSATNLHLIFALGRSIRVVKNSGRNLKLTFPDDKFFLASLRNFKMS